MCSFHWHFIRKLHKYLRVYIFIALFWYIPWLTWFLFQLKFVGYRDTHASHWKRAKPLRIFVYNVPAVAPWYRTLIFPILSSGFGVCFIGFFVFVYTLSTECLFFAVFGVETPITASFPSRSGANKCVFPGVTTIVWIGMCNGISKTGFSLFVVRIQ